MKTSQMIEAVLFFGHTNRLCLVWHSSQNYNHHPFLFIATKHSTHTQREMDGCVGIVNCEVMPWSLCQPLLVTGALDAVPVCFSGLQRDGGGLDREAGAGGRMTGSCGLRSSGSLKRKEVHLSMNQQLRASLVIFYSSMKNVLFL